MNDVLQAIKESNKGKNPVYDAVLGDDESALLGMLQNALTYGAPNIKRQSTNALRLSVKIVGTTVEIGGATTHPRGYVKYAAATNNKWESPRWKGRQNPNEGWADKITMQVCAIFAMKYGYRVVVS
jgi:hypothetical protein